VDVEFKFDINIENPIELIISPTFENSSFETILNEMYEPAVIGFKENVRVTRHLLAQIPADKT